MSNKNKSINDVRAYLKKGNRLQQKGKILESIKIYNLILNINSESVPALNQLRKIYEKEKQFDKAIFCCQSLIKLEPQNSRIYAHLAKLLMKEGSHQDSIFAYKKVFTLQLQQPPIIYKQFKDALMQYGDSDEAMTAYLKILQSKSLSLKEIEFESVQALHSSLGNAIVQLCIKLDKLKEALNFFRTLSQNHYNNRFWHYYHQALVLYKLGDLDSSIDIYKQSIQACPFVFYQAYTDLASIFADKKMMEEAFHYCIKAINSRPEAQQAHKICRVCFQSFSKNFSSIKLEEYLKIYINAVNIEDLNIVELNQPNIPYFLMGQICLTAGKTSQSILFNKSAIYNQLIKSKPEFINNYWNQGVQIGPQFLIIGVMKCGTTSLYDYMIQHPKILPAIIKEPNNVMGLGRGVEQNEEYMNYYLSLFPPVVRSEKFMTGEASNAYFFNSSVKSIVKDYFPTSKLIVILRNPVKRIISQYQYLVRMGVEKSTLTKVIDTELKLIKKEKDWTVVIEKYAKNNHWYLAHGLYIYFLNAWMNIFPREQFLILTSENLSRKPIRVMKQVFDFLDLPEYDGINYSQRNVGSYAKEIEPDLLSRLRDFYQPHNKKLEELLGQKFNWD